MSHSLSDSHAGPQARRVLVWTAALLASALLLGIALTTLAAAHALVFIVSDAPFVVVSAVPQLVTTVVWPVTALLTTYAWANGVAREDPTGGSAHDGRLEGQEPAPVT